MNKHFLFRHIRILVPVWAIAASLFASWSRADEPPVHSMENRFLFVIDNSSAMKARKQGVQEAVNALLESNLKGELRKGDTIGLWTYNDHLDTDFPMEIWNDAKKGNILSEVRGHLNRLHYEKRAHLDKIMPAITDVIKNSERVTVILIFDGSQPIKGTPFDTDLNDLHKRYSKEFHSSEEPFVTVLSAREGKVFDYTINYPSTVVLPHTADPLPPPVTNTPPVVAVAPPVEPAPVVPRTNVQIILSGADFAPKPVAPSSANHLAAASAIPTPAPAPVVATNIPPPAEEAPGAIQAAETNVATPQAKPTPPTPSPVKTNMAKTNVTANATLPEPPTAAPPVASNSANAPALAAATSGELTMMFVIAISLLTIAVVLVVFLLRRWRRGPQPSLISQSIDRSR
jgi:hypothetical protein